MTDPAATAAAEDQSGDWGRGWGWQESSGGWGSGKGKGWGKGKGKGSGGKGGTGGKGKGKGEGEGAAQDANGDGTVDSAKSGHINLDNRWACFTCGNFNRMYSTACEQCRHPKPAEVPDWRAVIQQQDVDGRPYSDKQKAVLFKRYIIAKRTVTVHDCPDSFKEETLYQHWAALGGRKAFAPRWVQMKDQSSSFWALTFRTPELAAQALALGPPTFAELRLRTREDVGQLESLKKRAWELLGDVDLTVLNEGKRARLRPAQWSPKELADHPITKAFPQALKYDDHDGRRVEVYQAFYEEHTLSVLPHPIEPVLRWEEVDFGAEVNEVLRKFPHPTPIQSLAWPALLAGRDCIGLAKTGSGKTLAFLLPAVVHIRAQSATQPKEGPIVLILAPVRELVLQIASEAAQLKNAGFALGEVTGGHGFKGRLGQAEVVLGGVDLLVAAPKRLATFVECHVVRLNRVSYFVIDEADRMLDLGFDPQQIKELVSQLRPDRQTSMFTATWGQLVHSMALEYLRHDVAQIVACGGTEESTMANPNVEQRFICNTTDFDRAEELVKLVRDLKRQMADQNAPYTRILIFCNRTRVVDDTCVSLAPHFPNVYSLHSDLMQAEREGNLRHFAEDPHAILVATDLAGRGLDIKGLPYVINLQLPREVLQYIHRIGRTGRAGQKGVAISFLEHDHRKLAPHLIKILENVGQAVPEGLLALRDQPHLFFSSEFEAAPIFSHGVR